MFKLTKKKINQKLLKKSDNNNLELLAYIKELEDTLNSIKSNEVDALIVSSSDGDKIFSVSSAETPYRILIEQMNEGAAVLNSEGIILYCNKKLSELLDIKLEQTIGSNLTHHFNDNEKSILNKLINTGIKSKCTGDISYTSISNKFLNFHLSLSPLPIGSLGDISIVFADITELKLKESELIKAQDTLEQKVIERTNSLNQTLKELEGSRINVVNMLQLATKSKENLEYVNKKLIEEIADRKFAEKALIESEEKYLELLMHLPDAIVIHLNNKLVFVNDACIELMKAKNENNLIGRSILEFVEPSQIGDMKQRISRALNDGKPLDLIEEIYIRLDGTYVEVETKALPITYDNQKAILIVTREITERKKAEKEIKEKNIYLSEMNASKDKFFSVIAHDLKSPFSGFLGLTKLMSEDINSFSIKELRNVSNLMQDSAKNLFKLLENLLDWSRMQRGVTIFEPKTYNLNKIVTENISIQFSIASLKEITFINKIDSDIEVFIDVSMINGVFRNLLSNSIKFTPRHGIIEIGSNVRVYSSMIEIYIKDNGIGMDSEILNNLFNLNSKISRPGTEDEPSTGLGLILCKEFVEKQNGKIWAESEEDNGSTFYFTLPNSFKE
jgi:PAS domain S-box-containing protein